MRGGGALKISVFTGLLEMMLDGGDFGKNFHWILKNP